MSTSRFSIVALCLTVGAGCVSVDPASSTDAVVAAVASSPRVAAQPREAAAPAPVAQELAVEPQSYLGGADLALWNDAGFRRRFTESYLAETDIEPRVTEAERERLQGVLDAIAADDLDKALTLLGKGRGPASSAVIDFMVANIHFQRDEFEPAAAAYQVAVEKFPKFRRAWKNLGLIHVRAGAFDRAADAFTRVVELGGGDSVTYGLLGYCHSNLGNHMSAESAYRMAMLLDGETIDWKMGLARSFFEQRRYADAASLVELLIEAQPDRADLWLLQANAYIGLGQPERAAQNYEIVERLGGSTADSLNMLGDIYVNAALFDLAASAYVRALERDEKATATRALRAAKVLTARGALDHTRDLVAAIERLRGETLTGVERKDLLKLRARLAVAAGADGEEVAVLQEIVGLDPLDGDALILLGQHAGRTGDTERAVFYYERAASLEEFEADAKVRHAQLLVGEGRYNEALPLLRRAQTLRPREAIQDYLEQVERIAQNR